VSKLLTSSKVARFVIVLPAVGIWMSHSCPRRNCVPRQATWPGSVLKLKCGACQVTQSMHSPDSDTKNKYWAASFPAHTWCVTP